MKVSLIAALTRDRLIGRDNAIPWHLPRDLSWFREQTIHKQVLMGRNTYESIGRPLPMRDNIVLSRERGGDPRVTWVTSVEEALNDSSGAEELMVIGGATVYQQTLELADRLYLTLVEAELTGDTYFPSYNEEEWLLVWQKHHPADATNCYGCQFMILDRKGRRGHYH